MAAEPPFAKVEQAMQARPALPRWLPWVLFATLGSVVAAYLVYLAANYYVKAYSDPIHWLEFGRDLPGQWREKGLAPGYPIFLWAVLKVTGPFYVFLANAPLLILLALMVGGLTALALDEKEPRAQALLGGAAAVALLFYVDPHVLLYLVNPYREPLVFVLLFAALLLVISAGRTPKACSGRMTLAGLLIGFSYATRETAVLFLPAIGLYGLVVGLWFRRGSGWKPAVFFGLGLFLGAAPALIHNWSYAGQAVVPSYSASKGRLLPGMYVRALHWTSSHALAYYVRMGPVVLSAAGLGLIYAVARRNRILLALVAPALAVNIGFYVFYWTFVIRYFFVCHLLLAVFMACGFTALVSVLLGRWRGGRWVTPALAALLCWLAGIAAARMLALRPTVPPFQISDARRFVADLEEQVPAGALILTPRVLCEVVSYFTRAEAYPAAGGDPEGVPDPEPLRARIQEELDRGRPVFVLRVLERPEPALTFEHLPLGQFVHRAVRTYPAEDYALVRVQGDVDLALYAIEGPWRQTEVRSSARSTRSGDAILRINAWDVWTKPGPRSMARFRAEGYGVETDLRDGANYTYLPSLREEDQVRIVLRSDQPLPENLQPEFLDPTQPLVMDFRRYAVPSHEARLEGAFVVGGPGADKGVLLAGSGTVSIPTPWPQPALLLVHFHLLSASEVADGKVDLLLETLNPARQIPSIVKTDRTRRVYTACLLAADGDEQEPVGLALVPPRAQGEGEEDGILLSRVEVVGRPLSGRASVDVSAETDKWFLGAGWHARGRLFKDRWGAWSSERSDLDLYLEPAAGEYVLRLYTFQGYRPPQAPAENLRLEMNGVPLAGLSESDAEGRERVTVAPVPRASLRPGLNRLTVISDPWVPAEVSGSKDRRRLGVLLARAVLEPAASGSGEGP